MFSEEELAQFEVKAKAAASAVIIQQMAEQLITQAGCVIPASLPEPLAKSPVADECVPSVDWVIEPTPADVDEFKEVSIYGFKLRVNRSGTKVECYVDGQWKNKAIIMQEAKLPYVVLPNKYCSSSKAKGGETSCTIGRLVLEAFSKIPDYIETVHFSPKGPSLIFGLKLYVCVDGNKNNCHLDNLEWISKSRFNTAVKVKAKRFGIALPFESE